MSLCNACKNDHDPLMRCEVAAKLRLTATNGGEDATNEQVGRISGAVGEADVEEPGEVSGGAVVVGKTANRRTREAYNAYQREYMRRRRAR